MFEKLAYEMLEGGAEIDQVLPAGDGSVGGGVLDRDRWNALLRNDQIAWQDQAVYFW